MSLPDFKLSKFKLPSSPGLPMAAKRGKTPASLQLSGTVPGVLDALTPPLPSPPNAWLNSPSAESADAARSPTCTSPSASPVPAMAWREALLDPSTVLDDATLVQQVQRASLDELEQPYGLNGTTVLLDLCRHGRVDAIHAALDRGANATATTTQGLSAVDLLVLPAMNDQVNGANPDLDPSAWLLNPSERQLQAVERLQAAGARFDPETLPLLAASPLGIRLEQRALRSAMASRPALASVSALRTRSGQRL